MQYLVVPHILMFAMFMHRWMLTVYVFYFMLLTYLHDKFHCYVYCVFAQGRLQDLNTNVCDRHI